MNEQVVLETPQGELLGAVSESAGKRVRVFKGIPYAVPPVGSRRWKPAEPAPKWEGVRKAVAFAPHAIQPSYPEENFYYYPASQTSEDCLYLNVWAPEQPSGELPVMVWIHGGSLVEGGTAEPLYDGSALAGKHVVVVSIQYRLNIFGYFSHPELTLESPHQASGNYGTTDQIQALKWVQENISSFGGDPNNVTIFGESAGGLSVTHLLASPLSKGLFHRAIAQSPYLIPMPALKTACYGKKSAEEIGTEIAAMAKASTLAGLRNLSANELLKLSLESNFLTEAVVDNWVFPAQIFEQFEQGRQHDVPVLLGSTSGEVNTFESSGTIAPVPTDVESYLRDIKARYGDLAEEYLEQYPADNLHQAVFSAVTDGFFGWASERLAKMTENVCSEAYLYCFDQTLQWAEEMGLGAFHASEISFVFNHLQSNAKYSPNWPDHNPDAGDIALSDCISDYWVAFAGKGAPDHQACPQWKPYLRENPCVMVFRNGQAVLEKSTKPGVFELHEKIIAGRREAGDQDWGITTLGLSAPIRKL